MCPSVLIVQDDVCETKRRKKLRMPFQTANEAGKSLRKHVHSSYRVSAESTKEESASRDCRV